MSASGVVAQTPVKAIRHFTGLQISLTTTTKIAFSPGAGGLCSYELRRHANPAVMVTELIQTSPDCGELLAQKLSRLSHAH